jgi:hypothetical protein
MKPHAEILRTAAMFLLLALAGATGAQLPPSKGAPQVGQKAPDFTLADSTGKPVRLSELLAPAGDAAAKKGGPWVLLIFYRGYW